MPSVGMHPCTNCLALMYAEQDGYCPSNGKRHVAYKTRFMLPYGGRESSQAQADWLRCTKCQVVYWAGDSADQGVCDLGGAHQGERDQNFLISHGIPVSKFHQADWEYCTKCRALFYDGGESKGNCAAGGPHDSDSGAFHFVLSTESPQNL
jgi:hypothetical protein